MGCRYLIHLNANQDSNFHRFLLAQLHFDRLTDFITSKAIIQALEDLPTGSGAYDYAYDAAMDRIHRQSPSRRELAIKTLSWITHAKRPLSAAELQHALGVEIGENRLDEGNIPQIEDVVSTTVGLVIVDGESDIIRLVHYTTQEFFERTQEKWLPDAKTYLAEVCGTYLSFSTFGGGLCKNRDEYGKRLSVNKLYEYAAMNWISHVMDSEFPQSHLTFTFLRKTPNINAALQASQGSRGFMFTFHPFLRGMNPLGITGLHIAAECGWTMIVEVLLRDIADPDLIRDSCNRTPFYLAAIGGHVDIMKLLLDSGNVDVNVISEGLGYTPLICAAQGGHTAAVKLLLDTGKVNAGSRCAKEKSALWYAAIGRHVDVVQLLLDERIYDPDMVCDIHSSALLGAVIMGEDAIVKLLLAAGHADLNTTTRHMYHQFSWDGFGKPFTDTIWKVPYVQRRRLPLSSLNRYLSPLCLAVKLGHESLVKLFLGIKEVDVALPVKEIFRSSRGRYRRVNGTTALFVCASEGRVDICQTLLNSGRFDNNSRGPLGQTPLIIAASQGHKSLVEFLLNTENIDVDARDRFGRTALFAAAATYHPKAISIVNLLIDTGKANINAKDYDGQTPLCYAARYGDESVFRMVLGIQGIDFNSPDDNGRTALMFAVAAGRESIIQLCLETGKFDVNARDCHGLTPLLLAAQWRNGFCDSPETIQLLLDTGNIEIDARDDEHKRTALMWAAYAGVSEIFKLLLQTGKFNINERDVDGLTPFAIAAQQWNADVVEFLLNEEGVDFHTRDYNHGRTALMWAAHNRAQKTLILLLHSGKFDANDVDLQKLNLIASVARKKTRDIVRLLDISEDVVNGMYQLDTRAFDEQNDDDPTHPWILVENGTTEMDLSGIDNRATIELGVDESGTNEADQIRQTRYSTTQFSRYKWF